MTDREGDAPRRLELVRCCRWCSVPACNYYVYHQNGDDCPEREAFRILAVEAALTEVLDERKRRTA